ncbi:MAG: glycosyl transferase [Anaerolineae bacterium]|nr:glycosyl transferase [Anaerolineae bacterium]
MTHGHFDDSQREYVITNPRTPAKWINYLGTLAFGGLIDHTGGMLICKQDPGLNRILKYIPQMPDSDFKGSTLYLRFKAGQGDAYTVFSPYFVPTLDVCTLYECHVGLGYTRIVSECHGIRSESTFFVPQGDERVIWDTQITNLTGEPLEIDAIPVVEYSHFDALKQFNNADWVPQTMQSRVSAHDGVTVLRQYAFMKRETAVNYLTSNLPVSSFESERKHFLGDNGYGSWAAPLSLRYEHELGSHEANRGDNIGALMHHLGTLQPGECRRLIVQLGQAASVADALPGIRRYLDGDAVDAAFADLERFWNDYLNTLQVETPDASMNSMLNIHHPRQCHTTKNWSRYLSLYQLGMGSRGIGCRDSAQDVLGVIAHMPEESKALVQKLLSVQLRNGSAMHQFFPLTMEATCGDAAESPDRPQYYSDDHLWIVLAVCAYLAETGDFAFLDEVVPFYDKDAEDRPLESVSVRDHMLRGIDFTRGNVGQHGLPLLGFADWNDTMNLPTGAESLFTAHLYGLALRQLVELFQHLGKEELAARCEADYDEMRERVNAHAWDGEWYVRYFTAEGEPIGAQRNRYGQIFINAQSWSVMSGFAPADRAASALESVNQRLNTANGIKMMTPGFDGFDPMIGGASTYPPGAKENGGIFLHTNPWVMIAETLLGHGDLAYQYYDQINPAAKNTKIDEYEIEPYAYAQNILADEHPQAGLGRNSWLSGTAAWVYRAATQHMLGVAPTYNGLRIDPCIPTTWDGFKMTRKYRGATYEISVRNPQHVSTGVASVTVDGALLEGTTIPIFSDGQRHQVVVVMG